MPQRYWTWGIGCLLVMASILLCGPDTQRVGAQAELEPRAFLPIVFRPVTGSITFGTATDSNGVPSPPQTSIPPGTRRLFYNANVVGAAGRSYRLEWTINGVRESNIDDIGTVPGNNANINSAICFNTAPGCDDPSSPLRSGTYILRLFVDNLLITEATATVRTSLDHNAESVAPITRR